MRGRILYGQALYEKFISLTKKQILIISESKNMKGATKLRKDGDYIVMDAGKGKITTPIRRT